MNTLLLAFIARFFYEFSLSSGKKAFQKHRETVYSLGFITYTSTLIFFIVGVLLGTDFYFNPTSIRTLVPRIMLEIIIAHLSMKAVLKASRTTSAFLSNITIPLLLLSDFLLAYSISNIRLGGICLIILSILVLMKFDRKSHKGASLVLVVGVISAITTTLYKYDITHFNSVAAEQIISLSCVSLYFLYMVKIKTSFKHWRYALSSAGLVQSVSMGFSSLISSYAYSLAPASVVVSMLNGSTIIWGMIFGRTYFHEHGMKVKLFAACFVICGLLLLTIG